MAEFRNWFSQLAGVSCIKLQLMITLDGQCSRLKYYMIMKGQEHVIIKINERLY